MKMTLTILSVFAASAVHSAALAHEALVPHRHPHATSMFPGIESIGTAALVLAIAAIAFTYYKRG
jgi:hypothetical protein